MAETAYVVGAGHPRAVSRWVRAARTRAVHAVDLETGRTACGLPATVTATPVQPWPPEEGTCCATCADAVESAARRELAAARA